MGTPASFFVLPGRVVILVLAVVCLLEPVRAAADDTVRLHRVREHWVTVPVVIAGAGPFEVLLDTGTNVTVIQPELARQLALQPTARATLETAMDGPRVVPYARLPHLSVGDTHVEDVEVVFRDLRDLRALEPHISGILGHNVLERFSYTLDHRRCRIVLGAACPGVPDGGERLPIEWLDGRVIVQAYGVPARTERPLRLVLDSGVARLVLFEAGARTLWIEPERRTRAADLIAAPVPTVRMGQLAALRLGQLTLRGVPVATMAGEPDADGRYGDGLLPTSLFDALFVNVRERYIVLNPCTPK